MNIPVFVINLLSRDDRWNSIKSASDKADLEINRIEAINGRAIADSDWENTDKRAFARNTAREIYPGEYGCYFSHMLALKAFVDSEAQFGIILEDDVIPDSDLNERVVSIIEENIEFDIVKLVNHRAVGFITLSKTSKGDKVGRTLFGPQGSAAAYLVSRKGALKLINRRKVMCLPWDVALERYWEIDANVLTIKDNLLIFSEKTNTSSIAPQGYGKKISWGRRLLTVLRLQLDHCRRFHHAALGPKGAASIAHHVGFGETSALINHILCGSAILFMLSAFLFETDIYRYAGLTLVTITLVYFFGREVWRYDRPLIGFAGVVCLLWALYILIRMGVSVLSSSDQGLGSAEGIYLFPAFYSTTGFGIWLFIRKPLLLVILFVLGCLFFLLAFTDYSNIASGARGETFTHNNTIHAAAASGFILIFATCFTFYIATLTEFPKAWKTLLVAVGLCVLILALVNILIFLSKGVWLAIAISFPFLFVSLFGNINQFAMKNNYLVLVLIVATFIIGGVVIAQHSNKLFTESQATIRVGLNLISDITAGYGLSNSMEKMIDSPHTPFSARERLILWVDAIKIWSESPIFGVGIDWRAAWNQRAEAKLNSYNIFHNGFLEIGVRYGFAGLSFYMFIFIWATRKVFLASKYNLLPPIVANCYLATLIFFMITILTNSNNRLAIGECYIWLAISFGFYSFYLIQEKGLERPRTWI